MISISINEKQNKNVIYAIVMLNVSPKAQPSLFDRQNGEDLRRDQRIPNPLENFGAGRLMFLYLTSENDEHQQAVNDDDEPKVNCH